MPALTASAYRSLVPAGIAVTECSADPRVTSGPGKELTLPQSEVDGLLTRHRSRASRSSPSSAGPTWASPRSSTGSLAPGRRSWKTSPGTTRDRLYGEAEWSDQVFIVVDTGGLEPNAAEGYSVLIREQVEVALAEADAILFVVDASIRRDAGRRRDRARYSAAETGRSS